VSAKQGGKDGLLELDDPTALEASEAPGPARPTARPAFDANEIFEDAEFRERMPTITDDDLLEEARQASLPSQAPPGKGGAPPPAMPKEPPPAATAFAMPKEPPPAFGDAHLPPARARMPSVEILAGEEDLDQLHADEQIAILRARLAPLKRVPALARSLAELGLLLEDPKTAYVMGFVDGLLPFETIIDVTGLPELDTLRILDKVAAQGLFVYGKPGR
jgi:hypothetical protein